MSVQPARRAFFFPHGRTPSRTPGRVPFEARGRVVSVSAESREAAVTVMADGYLDAQRHGLVGSNQDPCVFSAPWGLFHSFCRLDGAHLNDERVSDGTTIIHDSLAVGVREGDVIIYGKSYPPSAAHPLRAVWVDAVLVVDRTVSLPVVLGDRLGSSPARQRRPYRFDTPFHDQSLPQPTTAAYLFNLSDADPAGMHCRTRRNPHLVIVGVCDATRDALTRLETSLVPLASRLRDAWEVCAVDARDFNAATWSQLEAYFRARVYGRVAGPPRGGRVSVFPRFSLAQALVAAVVRRSGTDQALPGTVAVPPLTPIDTAASHRWSPTLSRPLTNPGFWRTRLAGG
jgi:hypothetical protein